MNRLYEVTDGLLLWQTIGCLIGLCVSIVLLQLVRACWSFRSLRWPGLLLSISLLVWNCGGLLNALLIVIGFDYQSVPAKAACAFGYTGLTCVTWTVLGVWALVIEGRWRRRVHKTLQTLAAALGTVITVWLWTDALNSNAPLSRTGIRIFAETNLYLFVLIAILAALSSRPARTTWVCAALTAAGLLGPVTALALIPVYPLLPQAVRVGLSVYAEQSVNYIAAAGFLLLAKLRYADILVQRALRVLSVIFIGAAISYIVSATLAKLPQTAHMHPASALALILSVTILALAMKALDRELRGVTHHSLRQPDFETELNRLAEILSSLHEEAEVISRIPITLKGLFRFSEAEVLPSNAIPENLKLRLTSREIVEDQPGSRAFGLAKLDADTLVPIFRNGSGASYVIAIARHFQWGIAH